jgi:hypothetical protein
MRSFVFLAGGLAIAGLLSMPLAAEAAPTKKKPAATGQSKQQSAPSNSQPYDRHAPVS